MRDTLIKFMDELREYVAESGTNIAHDERDSSEFVDIFLNRWQLLPIDSVSVSFSKDDMKKCADFWNGKHIEQKYFDQYLNER